MSFVKKYSKKKSLKNPFKSVLRDSVNQGLVDLKIKSSLMLMIRSNSKTQRRNKETETKEKDLVMLKLTLMEL